MVFAAVFGVPGQKTRECSPARGAFRQRIVSGVDDGPVRVSGLNKGVESLKAALDEAEEQIPDVVAALKTAGMLCVRVKRTNPNSFSNHGWGSALDLFSDEQPIESSHLGVHAGASGNQLVVGYQSLSDKKLKNIPDPVRIHRLLPRPEPYPRSNFRGTPRWRDLKPLIEERAANRLHGPASGSSRCREWKRCGALSAMTLM